MAKENFEITPEQENRYDAIKETPQWERNFDEIWNSLTTNQMHPAEYGVVKNFIRNLLRQQEEFWELKLEEEIEKTRRTKL